MFFLLIIIKKIFIKSTMSHQDWNDVVWRKNKSSQNTIHNDKDAPKPITVDKYRHKNN